MPAEIREIVVNILSLRC